MKKLDIIYEDKDIIVVNKEHHLLTVSNEKEKEHTLYHEVSDYLKKKNPKNKVFIIHRLDKDTSGVILFAKNQNIKRLYQDNWNTLVKKRGYIAIVEGLVKEKKGTIKSYLVENSTQLVYTTKDTKLGKLAITNYEVIQNNKEYSLVNIEIITGRKNQIRVHMKEFGHPIIGDKKYDSRKNPIRRLGLHANILIIENPITKKDMEFKAKIPKQFNSIFKIV